MNYQHPFSSVSREYFITTPVVPAVKGRIVSVDVKPNVPVKRGDVLFKAQSWLALSANRVRKETIVGGSEWFQTGHLPKCFTYISTD